MRSFLLLFVLVHSPFGVFAQKNCSTDDPLYSNSFEPIVGATFYWEMGEDTISGKLVYTGGDSWLSVGFSNDGKMLSSEAVLGQPDSPSVTKVLLSGYSPSGIVEMSAQTLTGMSTEATDGVSTLEFTKLLQEPGEIPILLDGRTILIFAIGSGTQLGIHAFTAAVSIDLNRCVSGASTDDGLLDFVSSGKTMSTSSVVAHGIGMVVAWMYLVPCGVITATFKEDIGRPRWVTLHMIFQAVAIMTMVFAIVMIVTSIDDSDGEHMKENKTKFGIHTILGVEALSIAGFQALLGIFRPHHAEPGKPPSMLRNIFEIVHSGLGHVAVVVALFAILSGIEQAYLFGYITSRTSLMWLSLLPFSVFFLVLLLALVIALRRAKNNKESHGGSVRAPFLFMYVVACFLAIGLNGPDVSGDNPAQ